VNITDAWLYLRFS